MNNSNKSLTILEAATLVGTPPEELLREALQGRLEISVPLDSLLTWVSKRNSIVISASQDFESVDRAERGRSETWSSSNDTLHFVKKHNRADIDFGEFKAIQPFTHIWPDRYVEEFYEAYQVKVQVKGKERTIVVALTQRDSVGLEKRARAAVFYNLPPKQRALVEFNGNGTVETVTTYASPIKLEGGSSHLIPGEAIPDEYSQLELDIFSNVVQGPYASNSVAVVVRNENKIAMLQTMATHGVIRGVYKGWF